ncbi:AppA, periplasmic binding component [Alkalihalophilus pseudofirmus OF4]|uniref:AppA, periplasmic binding component n=1 Tax=Alkalihalophilus pseudofirmus (strain ATCC BAA-2126 / JCM 17055 / OF4) TaxID=398511 RepID=D3FZG6_ALKPO|nr:peptide-binding protein [Alkalihalophilus pseudofirmus]ADC49208.1 AppA, periplasmic binding component [Alkalihalophilus pseudofirmus OF4]
MTKKSLLVLLGMVMALMLVLAACGGSDEPASTDEDPDVEDPVEGEGEDGDGEEAASGEPQQGGSIVLSTSGEPVTFNPLYIQDTASSDVADMIHAQLIEADPELNLTPSLATELPEISEDGLEHTYTIHEGVLFHDGEELTAEDVKFTYDIFIHEDYTGPRAGDFEYLDSVEVIDDYTVKFILSDVDATFSTRTTYGILPKHILDDVPVADLEEHMEYNRNNPIGAGPFEFVEYVDGQYIELVAHEDYFADGPYLDKITWRVASDSNAELLLFETGETDHMILPATEYATAETYDHGRISSTLALRYDYIGWNNERPLFQDPKVRQALTMAIDRQLIVDEIMEGRAEVAHAPASPLSWAYPDSAPEFDYDPEGAKELLAEAGWEPGADGILEKDGERFAFEILSNDGNVVRRDIGVIVQQMLGDIGIEVEARQMEWGAFLEQTNPPNRDFDAVVLAWGLGLDPDPSAIWHSRENQAGLNSISYNNPTVDELADANKKIVDQDERAEAISEIFQIVAEEQPYTFLFYPEQHVLLNNRLQGFTHHPRLNSYKVNEWYVTE